MFSVTLSWDHDGVNTEFYSVKRRIFGVGNFVELTRTPLKTYVDATVAANTRYEYTVLAGNVGAMSPIATTDVNVQYPTPAAPTNLTGTVTYTP